MVSSIAGLGKCRQLKFVEPAVLKKARLDQPIAPIAVVAGDGPGRRARAPPRLAPAVGTSFAVAVGGLQPRRTDRRALAPASVRCRGMFGTAIRRSREVVVALGAVDQAGEPALGEFRAGLLTSTGSVSLPRSTARR